MSSVRKAAVAVVWVMAMLLLDGCTVSRAVREPLCDFTDFQPSPYDHIVNQQRETFVASELSGRLTVDPREMGGGWPQGMDPRLELHGPDGFSEFIVVAEDGTFARKGLRAGSYCFKLSTREFRSVVGRFVIDPGNRAASVLEITMRLAD